MRPQVFVSVSTEFNLSVVKELLRQSGFVIREIRKRRIPAETIYVYECARAAQ